ncbi:MAG: transcriptional regulator [Bacteroidota bacterium]
MDLKKEFLKKRDNDPPAIGNFINYHIYINKIKKKKVSDYLSVLPTTLNNYFKQSSLQLVIVWRVSQIVEHNFLMELGERLDIAYETKAEKELKAQLAEKDKQIEKLQTQMEVLERMHKMG